MVSDAKLNEWINEGARRISSADALLREHLEYAAGRLPRDYTPQPLIMGSADYEMVRRRMIEIENRQAMVMYWADVRAGREHSHGDE
jgi:hypothetical protein